MQWLRALRNLLDYSCPFRLRTVYYSRSSRGSMKYALFVLALLGITVASLALREHYREYGDSPCSINEHWDCGVVNHSPFAMIGPIPVAVLGIAGYILMGVL